MKKALFFAAALSLSVAFAAGSATAADGAAIAKKCQGCHGKDGIGKGANNPNLAGQKKKYMVNQLKAFKSGKRNNPIMKMQAKKLSDEDMEAVAAFYADMK
ncbi:c-type cytochrome [Magnetococcales bacterium HHB-1]